MKKAEEAHSNTMLVLCTAFLLLYLALDIRPFLWTALVIGVLGSLSTAISLLVHRGWMALANLLGRSNGFVLLTIVYLTIVLPVALVRRALGIDGLQIKRRPERTAWKDRDHSYMLDDIRNPW